MRDSDAQKLLSRAARLASIHLEGGGKRRPESRQKGQCTECLTGRVEMSTKHYKPGE